MLKLGTPLGIPKFGTLFSVTHGIRTPKFGSLGHDAKYTSAPILRRVFANGFLVLSESRNDLLLLSVLVRTCVSLILKDAF